MMSDHQEQLFAYVFLENILLNREDFLKFRIGLI